jgi:hypothetical protein
MSIKISDSQSVVAHHIIDGPVTFPYKTDARSAVARFPGEWSFAPWSHDAEVKAREAAGQSVVEVTPEEQAAIDEHAQAVAEATERLKAFREKQAEEKKIAEQVAADEALVKSAPPRPEPKAKPLTGAQIRKRAAETDDERIVREKDEQDQWANASAGGAPITG